VNILVWPVAALGSVLCILSAGVSAVLGTLGAHAVLYVCLFLGLVQSARFDFALLLGCVGVASCLGVLRFPLLRCARYSRGFVLACGSFR